MRPFCQIILTNAIVAMRLLDLMGHVEALLVGIRDQQILGSRPTGADAVFARKILSL